MLSLFFLNFSFLGGSEGEQEIENQEKRETLQLLSHVLLNNEET